MQFTGSGGSLVHAVHWFRWFTGSCGSPVHAVHWFRWFTSSCGSLVQVVHWVTGSGGSLVHVVHWFRWFTGSGGSLVQVVHWFRWFTGSGGSLVHCGSCSSLVHAVHNSPSLIIPTSFCTEISHRHSNQCGNLAIYFIGWLIFTCNPSNHHFQVPKPPSCNYAVSHIQMHIT